MFYGLIWSYGLMVCINVVCVCFVPWLINNLFCFVVNMVCGQGVLVLFSHFCVDVFSVYFVLFLFSPVINFYLG